MTHREYRLQRKTRRKRGQYWSQGIATPLADMKQAMEVMKPYGNPLFLSPLIEEEINKAFDLACPLYLDINRNGIGRISFTSWNWLYNYLSSKSNLSYLEIIRLTTDELKTMLALYLPRDIG